MMINVVANVRHADVWLSHGGWVAACWPATGLRLASVGFLCRPPIGAASLQRWLWGDSSQSHPHFRPGRRDLLQWRSLV